MDFCLSQEQQSSFKDLLNQAFSIILEEDVESIHDLANSLIDVCPETVVECFGDNPFEANAQLLDYLETAEYEDSVVNENLTIPEWIEMLASDGAKRLYSICESLRNELNNKK